MIVNPWQIGNTTIRNPYRLREGMRALSVSPLVGNLLGKMQQSAFAELLHYEGVLMLDRIGTGQDYSDTGRKWHAALVQLGFLTPLLSSLSKIDASGIDPVLAAYQTGFPELTGRPFEITPNGRRLIGAESVAAQQEVFLRALLSYQIPSPVEKGRKIAPVAFSPLRTVLRTLTSMNAVGLEPYISYEEFTLFGQFATDETILDAVAADIGHYRRDRVEAVNKKRFYREQLEAVTSTTKGQGGKTLQTDTVDTYTNLTLRYLKASGLFTDKGRGIMVADEKQKLVDQILARPFVSLGTADSQAYLENLWNGATLPTDEQSEGIEVVMGYVEIISARGGVVELPDLPQISREDLSVLRLDLEEQLRFIYEEDYAERQKDEWEDIYAHMLMLAGKQAELPIEARPYIPKAERPAYLEWVLWRSFLAINSLVNKPYDARHFKIDRDFLPVGHAPGGRPDMFFEFADFVMVVEVTLMSSSRQEAAEGEPVRRHVADYVVRHQDSGKDVYGLFIANSIDSNTAATFAIGQWYLHDDTRLDLSIVPLTLSQFATLFRAGFARSALSPEAVKNVLVNALALSNSPAPQWKLEIEKEVQQAVSQFEL